MTKILLTGAGGFIGRNVAARLERMDDIELFRIDVENTPDELATAVAKADFVMHLAGVNRPKDNSEFESGNRGFTEELVGMLAARKQPVPILISSSIQAALQNPYGISKLGAEEAIRAYGESSGAKTYLFRLPNVFGKWCRPNYNSVIATWCHNTTHNLPITVNDPSSVLSLVYIDDVAETFVAALGGEIKPAEDGFCHVSKTYSRTLEEVSSMLGSFVESRKNLVMPALGDDFARRLYATWLSYLPEDSFAYALEMKRDDRGWLAEFMKSTQFGQVFISKTNPGVTRGNHWHHTKVEKFLVISGNAVIRFRKIGEEKVIEYPVSGDELRVVDIPAGYTHSITNTGNDVLVTLFWADEMFDTMNPDTFSSYVLPS